MCNPDALHELLSDLFSRRTIVPTTIAGRTDMDDTKELVRLANSGGATYISQTEFGKQLGERSGFTEQVEAWLHQKTPPNGLARAIILTCAAQLNEELCAKYDTPVAA